MSTVQEPQKTGVAQTQKAISDNKQTLSIRKITIESISPVIAKVQEHIAFLVEQTTNLRKQNANLKAAQASQKVLEEQIVKINNTLDKLHNNITTFNQDKETKIIDHNNQLMEINSRIDKLSRQAINQGLSIEEINGKNGNYLEQIELNKQVQLESIENLKGNIENYYEQQIMKMNALSDQMDSLRNKVSDMEQQRAQDQQGHQKVANIAALYDQQREDIKKLMERVSVLENSVVMMDDYKKDKRYLKLQMELTKTSVREMIDEALTPQIRRFLPQLISKLDQLKAFDNRLEQLKQVLKSHEETMNRMEVQWNDKIVKNQALRERGILDVRTLVDQEVLKLTRFINEQVQSVQKTLGGLEEDVNLNKKIAQVNLEEKIDNLEEKTKNYITTWGQGFIETKKAEIYDIVQSLKPKQESKEQQKVFSMVYQIQPLVQDVKKQLETSRLELKEAKQTIDGKIALFYNQIIKVKSDVSIQATQTKKTLDGFNKKLKLNDTFNTDISQLVSKLTQSVILSFALEIEPLEKDKQIFVTYNDGLLFEIQGQNMRYRRKELKKQLVRRAVIEEFVKLIDKIVLNQPHLGWTQPQMKPSHFFTAIHSTYMTLNDQSISPQKERASSSGKAPPEAKFLSTQLNMPKIAHPRSRGTQNRETMSKTIDFQSIELKSPKSSRSRYEKQQELPVYRKNIRLKKMNQKQ